METEKVGESYNQILAVAWDSDNYSAFTCFNTFKYEK